MTVRAEAETDGLPGDWVQIVHPVTGGVHTCTRQAWEDDYRERGWHLAIDGEASDDEPG